MAPLVMIGAGCLVCLMPLALYLFFLAWLNQRQRPTLVSGPWDFVCVLLGLSGFLLLGGPILLSLFDSTLRSHLFSGNFEQMRTAWNANSKIWSTIAASYFALLVSCIVLFLLLRRRVTIVYNVDTTTLEETVAAALDTLSLPWQRVVGGFQIGGRSLKKATILDDDEAAEKPAASISPPPVLLAGQSAFMRIEAFPVFQHATLRWRDYDPLLRGEIEALDVARYFDAALGPEDSGIPKPNPAMVELALKKLGAKPSEALYVGDMAIDVETARNAGVAVWVLPTGSGDRQSLIEARPDRLVESMSELAAAILRR